jgi:hypothetical protein
MIQSDDFNIDSFVTTLSPPHRFEPNGIIFDIATNIVKNMRKQTGYGQSLPWIPVLLSSIHVDGVEPEKKRWRSLLVYTQRTASRMKSINVPLTPNPKCGFLEVFATRKVCRKRAESLRSRINSLCF